MRTKHGRRGVKPGSVERVFALAKSTWQNEAAAQQFMNTPHPELNGGTPVEVAVTDVGARQVEEAVERGSHGLPV
jgi:putative toxin-antitoxin system antitoxin component (TIGR02293 family)